jgi:hypothetical protein
VAPHPGRVRHRHAAQPDYPSDDTQLLFGGAIYAVLLLQKGHGDRVAADIAGFIAEKPES